MHLSEAAEERRLEAEKLIEQMKNSKTLQTLTSPNNNVNPQELYNNATIDNDANKQQPVITISNTDNYMKTSNNDSVVDQNNAISEADNNTDKNNTSFQSSINANTNNAINRAVSESTENETVIETNYIDKCAGAQNILELNSNKTDEENGNNVYLEQFNVDESSIVNAGKSSSNFGEGDSMAITSTGKMDNFEEEITSSKSTYMDLVSVGIIFAVFSFMFIFGWS